MPDDTTELDFRPGSIDWGEYEGIVACLIMHGGRSARASTRGCGKRSAIKASVAGCVKAHAAPDGEERIWSSTRLVMLAKVLLGCRSKRLTGRCTSQRRFKTHIWSMSTSPRRRSVEAIIGQVHGIKGQSPVSAVGAYASFAHRQGCQGENQGEPQTQIQCSSMS